jgi:hypothetical protein
VPAKKKQGRDRAGILTNGVLVRKRRKLALSCSAQTSKRRYEVINMKTVVRIVVVKLRNVNLCIYRDRGTQDHGKNKRQINDSRFSMRSHYFLRGRSAAGL